MNTKSLLLAALLLCAPLLQAQNPDSPEVPKAAPAEQSYLLTITLNVTDHGKKTIDQVYTLAVNGRNGPPQIRDGNKIPISTGSEGNKTQIQYLDIGTNIDLRDVHSVGSLLGMTISVENSSLAPEPGEKIDPVIRQTKYSISPVVPMGKQITVYSSNDNISGHKVEIELLVQPIPSK